MMWSTWWVWMVAGFGLGILELLVPAFVFLGFAIGAVLTGAILWLGIPPAGWMAESIPKHLLVFGVLSLIGWLGLRATLGVRKGQVKVWNRDVNDN